MALTPPTVDDLGTFRREPFASDETEWAGSVLQQVTDALWVTTGLDEPPADPRAQRLLNYALMDFALWVMAQEEARDEINSPFSGERIGSYSYQKMQQNVRRVQRGQDTGIYWLDMFFALLVAPQADENWTSSERVFNPQGLSFADYDTYEELRLQDPGVTLGWV